MNRFESSSGAGQGLPRGQLVLVFVLMAVGLSFLGLAGYRLLYPRQRGKAAEADLAEQVEESLKQRGYKPLSESLAKLLQDPNYTPVPTKAPLLLSEPAPDFSLEEVDGKEWKLRDALAKGPVVVVFYYGYHCDHCVGQLFALKKDFAWFDELGAQIVAISADPASLTKERYAKFGRFPFPVLSDPGNKVAEAYGVYHSRKDGKEGELLHGTFVVNRQGKVVWINTGDEPFTANQTLLGELARAEGKLGK